ncbi:MAG: TrbC/VirB2 family protein [Patescibacteria group bacterium]
MFKKFLKINYFLLFIVLIILLFSSTGVLAQTKSEYSSPSSGFANPLGTTDITTLLKKIISYLIMIGAPILAIMVIYGGYLILTAGDDPEKVKGGKNTILYATIGYIIIISSYGIIYIVKEVLGAK